MKEVEVKILEVNVPETIKKIVALGAEKVYEGPVDAVYFDFPNNILQNERKLLRLRKLRDKAELTFKDKKGKDKAKIADEEEVSVSDFETMRKMFKGMGLKEFRSYTKHRVSYKLNNIHFELDTIPEIPTFLEIEATSVEKVYEFVEKLGFKKEDALPWSGKDVKKHYGKE